MLYYHNITILDQPRVITRGLRNLEKISSCNLVSKAINKISFKSPLPYDHEIKTIGRRFLDYDSGFSFS